MDSALVGGTIHAAFIQAFRHPLVAPPPVGFRGGLVLEDGPETARLRHSRYWQPADGSVADATYGQHLGSRFVYAGPVYHHFGHFASEMVHRLLPSLGEQEGRRWLFVGALGDTRIHSVETAPAFFREALDFFGIAHGQVVVCTADSQAEDLFVSEQGSDFGGGPKPGYVRDLRAYWEANEARLAGDGVAAARIFVSRSHMTGGIFLGEKYLETVLAEAGFTVFRPEEHGWLAQMNQYRRAETVVFSEGSACHGTELLGEEMIGRCVLLSRRADHLDIFARVLRPRARSFGVFAGSTELGSIVGPRGGVPMAHLGVSLPDPGRLASFLADHDLAPAGALDRATFLREAEADLEAHVAHHEAAGSSTGGVHVERLRAAFEGVRRA